MIIILQKIKKSFFFNVTLSCAFIIMLSIMIAATSNTAFFMGFGFFDLKCTVLNNWL
jgi:hypothetical protein